MELKDFIEQHRKDALTVIRKSNFYKLLDDNDIEELVYCGLWEVSKRFNAERSSLFRFIHIVLNSYIIRLVRNKLKKKQHEVSINGMDFAFYDKENIKEYFTDTEWELVQPILTDSLNSQAKAKNLSLPKYKVLLKNIGRFIKKNL